MTSWVCCLMTTQKNVFKAKGGAFPAWRALGLLFICLLSFGCATSREDDYVASILAEAMADGDAVAETAVDTIQNGDTPDSSVSPPMVVSVSPAGTLSASPVAAVSVTVPASLATTIAPENNRKEILQPLTSLPEASASAAQESVPTVSEPTPDTAVAPPSAGVMARPESVPQATNAISGGHLEMLKPSDPTIQPDSVLWVSVTEDPSLNGRYVVNNSSAIDFGYVGLVFMQDMTVQQAEAVLKNVLEGRYLNHASVSVKIAKASYDSVGVMGNVEVPGEVKIGPGATITLNDALRRAGGLRGNRDSNRVKIIRGGLRSPFGPAAEGEVYSLVSAKGDLQIPSVFLRNNDLAYVFAAESPQLGGVGNKTTGTGKRVILLGEVPRRGIIEFAENEPCTLMYLLFKIGGLPRFAKADKIQIVRRGKDGREKTFVVNGEQLMNEGSPQNDVVLESGDRVIVPVRKIAFF